MIVEGPVIREQISVGLMARYCNGGVAVLGQVNIGYIEVAGIPSAVGGAHIYPALCDEGALYLGDGVGNSQRMGGVTRTVGI